MTAGAELGSRCRVTMATSGRLQMKKGLNFQGLRPGGDFNPAFLRSSVSGHLGGQRKKGGATTIFCPHCHCTVGRRERQLKRNILPAVN